MRHTVTSKAADVAAELERITAREFDAPVNIPDGGVKMKDLAHRVVLSQSAVSRLVDRPHQRKLVTKTEVPDDSRIALVCLTEEGRQVLQAAARSNAAAVDRALSSRLSDAEMRALGQLMDKVRKR